MAVEDKTSYETIVLSNYNEVMDFYNKNPTKFKQIYNLFKKEPNIQLKSSFKDWLFTISNNPKTIFFIKQENKELIGAIYGYNSADNKKFNLSMIAVKKEHRGKLHGTSLMAKAFSVIFRSGYESIYMNALSKTQDINKYLTGQLFDNRWRKRKFKSDFKYVLLNDPKYPSEHNIIKQKIPRRSIVK